MILFVFEGEKREPLLFDSIQKLFFPQDNNQIVCSFGNNIYELYRQIENMKIDGRDFSDIVSILKENLKGRKDNPLENIQTSDEFSEIYLFFDYDFQEDKFSLRDINEIVKKMIELFDNETENGKLYINYPMVESLLYTKQLPDKNYYKYTVTRAECLDFKHLASNFCGYPSSDFITYKRGGNNTEKIQNWNHLKRQNVKKANYICNGKNVLPVSAGSIKQSAIFDSQLKKYVVKPDCKVSVLNAFPIFLYDYFGR